MTVKIIEIEKRVGQLTNTQRSRLLDRVADAEARFGLQGNRASLVAWVVGDGSDLDVASLKREAGRRLNAVQVPTHIEVVNQLPRTPNGKLDRKRLVESHRNLSTSRVAPNLTSGANDVTDTLLSICRQLFREPNLDPAESFTSLGGDSLLSIQLVALAREQGVVVKPIDVLRSQSIAELALLVHSDKRADGFAVETAVDGVVEFRAGRRAGSILFAHDIGGSCSFAQHLFDHLDNDLTFYVSSQSQREGDTIESMASGYVDQWLQQDPDGPYFVLSYCWGALLGYEIARQLAARGKKLKILAVIDFGTEAAYRSAPRKDRLRDLLCGYRLRIRNRIRALRTHESLGNFIPAITKKLYRKLTGTPKPLNEYWFDGVDEDTEVIEMNVGAYFGYSIQPSPQKVALFRTNEGNLVGTKYVDETYAWRYLVGNQVTVHPVPGTHYDCIKPPNAESLAHAINRVIRSD